MRRPSGRDPRRPAGAALAVGGIAGPALLALSGLGLVGAGVFPATDAAGAFSRVPAHVAAALVAFLGAGLGLVFTARLLRRAPRWRGYAGYAFVSGIGVLLLFPVVFGLAAPPAGPLHPWLGLLQRVTVVVWFACVAALALGLLRLPGASAASG